MISIYLIDMEFGGWSQKCLSYKVNSIQAVPNPGRPMRVNPEQADRQLNAMRA